MNRFLVEKNNKTIGFAGNKEEYEKIVRMTFNPKKTDDYYAVVNLVGGGRVPLSVFVEKLMREDREKTWKKKSKAKAKKPRVRSGDIIDEKYCKWLGGRPCVISGEVATRGVGANNMHCHHVRGRGGIRDDHNQVPLMGHVHSWGANSYHTLGKESFVKKYGLLTDDVIEYFEVLAKEFHAQYLREMR